MKPMCRSMSWSATLAALLCGACSGDAGAPDWEQESVGSIEEPIVQGTTVTSNTLGTVAVYHGTASRPCSGTHLGDRWVLTARHCVQVDPQTDGALLAPSELFVTGALSPGAARPNPASLPAGSFSNVVQVQDFAATVDIAMIRLATPLNQSLVDVPSGRVESTNAQVGANLQCQGYGRFQNLSAPNTPAGDLTTGAGTLRQADLDVIGRFPAPFDNPNRSDVPFQLAFQRNASQQIVISGDSGGPCFNGSLVSTVNRSVDSASFPTRGFSVSVARDTPWSKFIDWWKLTDVGITATQPGFRNVVKHAVPRSLLPQVLDTVVRAGWVPVWVDGYDVQGAPFFNQIFAPSDGFTVVQLHDMTVQSFQTEFNNKLAQGLFLAQVDSYLISGQPRYAAIWDNRPRPALSAYHNVTDSQHIANFNSLSAQGFRPVNISIVVVNGQRRVTALWDRANVGSFATFSFMTEAQFQTQFNQQLSLGRRLAYVNGCMENGARKLTAIWNQTAPASVPARHAMTDAQYLSEQNAANNANRTPIALAGFQNGSAHTFAALWN